MNNNPGIGRRVWYWPTDNERSISGLQPFDAGIVYVHEGNDAAGHSLVNLAVKNELGYDVPGKTLIQLRARPADAKPGQASWMDYHVQQAKPEAQSPGPITMLGGETLGAEPVGG